MLRTIKTRGYGGLNEVPGNKRPHHGLTFGRLNQMVSTLLYGDERLHVENQQLMLVPDSNKGFHTTWEPASEALEISAFKGGSWHYRGMLITTAELELMAISDPKNCAETWYLNKNLTPMQAACYRLHKIALAKQYGSFQLNEPTVWVPFEVDPDFESWGSKFMLAMVTGNGPNGTIAFRKFKQLAEKATGMKVLKAYRTMGCCEEVMYEVLYQANSVRFRALQQEIAEDPVGMLGVAQAVRYVMKDRGKPVLLAPAWAISPTNMEAVLQVPPYDVFLAARAADSFHSDSSAWAAIESLGMHIPSVESAPKPTQRQKSVLVESKAAGGSSDWNFPKSLKDTHPGLRGGL